MYNDYMIINSITRSTTLNHNSVLGISVVIGVLLIIFDAILIVVLGSELFRTSSVLIMSVVGIFFSYSLYFLYLYNLYNRAVWECILFSACSYDKDIGESSIPASISSPSLAGMSCIIYTSFLADEINFLLT